MPTDRELLRTALADSHAKDQRIAELEAKLARILDPTLNLQSVDINHKGNLEVISVASNEMAKKTLLAMADSMRTLFETEGATNYVEAEVLAANGTSWIMTVAPRNRPTPHELRVRAEEALEEVNEKLDAVRDVLTETRVSGILDVVDSKDATDSTLLGTWVRADEIENALNDE